MSQSTDSSIEWFDLLSRLYEDHIERTDGLIFDCGGAPGMLRAAFVLDRLATLD